MDRPDLRVLSLGAGVQSTTLALMATHGEIEPADCAIHVVSAGSLVTVSWRWAAPERRA